MMFKYIVLKFFPFLRCLFAMENCARKKTNSKWNRYLTLFLLSFPALNGNASPIALELTHGIDNRHPIAILQFEQNGEQSSLDISSIIKQDLQHSGEFIATLQAANQQYQPELFNGQAERQAGIDYVLHGKIIAKENNNYDVEFSLYNVFNVASPQITSVRYQAVTSNQLRYLAHQISDIVYEKITNSKGIFSSRIAYVRATNDGLYRLEVADYDGYNPVVIYSSPEPISNLAWSPDGKQIAYVSYQQPKSGVRPRQMIFIADTKTGARKKISANPGINSSPAWSPDGSKLVLVKSDQKNPNLYLYNLTTEEFSQITLIDGIHTAPVWTADGNNIILTSDAGRLYQPQIYKLHLNSNKMQRLSQQGNYNTAASISSDDKFIIYTHRADNGYQIVKQNLNSDAFTVIANIGNRAAVAELSPNNKLIVIDEMLSAKQARLVFTTVDGRYSWHWQNQTGMLSEIAWTW